MPRGLFVVNIAVRIISLESKARNFGIPLVRKKRLNGLSRHQNFTSPKSAISPLFWGICEMSYMVIYKGEVCFIHSHEVIYRIEDLQQLKPMGVLLNIEGIERTYIKGKSRLAYVLQRSVFYLPSSINFPDSEWWQGVKNGQAK